jgi:hypothetical protein
VAIGIVPFGALVANILIDKGVLAQGTPEARQGLARGQMVGGIIGILWGGKPNASIPVQAGAPVPATVGGAPAPPLVVVPSSVGVVVAAGGAVNVAAAEGEMAASLSTGGDESAAGSGDAKTSNASGPIRNPKWQPRDINNPACANGCDVAAKQIQKQIGGTVVRITPRSDPTLGAYRRKNWGWAYHEVVVKEGRVYDAFTGGEGLPIDKYKALWEYADHIHFGF